MPRSIHPRVGSTLAACLLLSGCVVPGPEPVPETSPTPSAAGGAAALPGRSNAPWALQLTLNGDLTGSVAATAASQGELVNECTGRNSLGGRTWSSTFVLAGVGEPMALVVLAPGYHGPGTYSSGVSVQIHNADHSAVWQNRAADSVAWTIGNDEESGRVTAVLSNLADVTRKVTLSGNWSCRTS